jgi:two-component sensor histidine kinase
MFAFMQDYWQTNCTAVARNRNEGEHYIALNMTGYMKVSQFFAELTYNPGKYAELITQLPTIVEAIGKLPR